MQADDHRDGPPERSARQPDSLDGIVAEYVGRLNAGDTLDPFEILAAHPEWGAEILGRLEVYAELEREEEPLLGTVGDYAIRREIGRGGMGVVYEAWERSIGRVVALKVLPAGMGADRRATARFMREAQIAGQLRHPNIVGVHAMGVYEGTPYYSMELVDGETLAQILTEVRAAEGKQETVFGRMDTRAYYENIAAAFVEAARGLDHAHSKGVIHRDIKPSNLILDCGSCPRAGETDRQAGAAENRSGPGNTGRECQGCLRILDFGLARLEGRESLTVSGDFVGTPLYMSPEQARQRKIQVDHRTDIYSLGATLYELLTLRSPFKGKDHRDTLSQIIERDPVDPRKLNPRVPQDLETIVLKCLRKDPRDRYATAAELAQDLSRFVKGKPIAARPMGRWEKIRRCIVRRGRVMATRVLAIGLLLACGALLYGIYVTRLPEGRFEDVVVLRELNSPFSETSPTCSSDDRELYFGSTRLDGQEGRKGNFHIFVAIREDPGGPWLEPRNLEELNSAGMEEPGWLSPHGLKLYYARAASRKDPKDICIATRESRHRDARWTPVLSEELQAINTPEYSEDMPSLTADEREIYFHSDRPGGAGKRDLWVAIRPSDASPWDPPRPLDEINTLAEESQPSISSDGLTLWWTNRSKGEVWQAYRTKRGGRFRGTRRVEPPVNAYAWSGQFEVSPSWPAPGAPAYFIRSSAGSTEVWDFDILRCTWNPAPRKAPTPPGAPSAPEGAGPRSPRGR